MKRSPSESRAIITKIQRDLVNRHLAKRQHELLQDYLYNEHTTELVATVNPIAARNFYKDHVDSSVDVNDESVNEKAYEFLRERANLPWTQLVPKFRYDYQEEAFRTRPWGLYRDFFETEPIDRYGAFGCNMITYDNGIAVRVDTKKSRRGVHLAKEALIDHTFFLQTCTHLDGLNQPNNFVVGWERSYPFTRAEQPCCKHMTWNHMSLLPRRYGLYFNSRDIDCSMYRTGIDPWDGSRTLERLSRVVSGIEPAEGIHVPEDYKPSRRDFKDLSNLCQTIFLGEERDGVKEIVCEFLGRRLMAAIFARMFNRSCVAHPSWLDEFNQAKKTEEVSHIQLFDYTEDEQWFMRAERATPDYKAPEYEPVLCCSVWPYYDSFSRFKHRIKRVALFEALLTPVLLRQLIDVAAVKEQWPRAKRRLSGSECEISDRSRCRAQCIIAALELVENGHFSGNNYATERTAASMTVSRSILCPTHYADDALKVAVYREFFCPFKFEVFRGEDDTPRWRYVEGPAAYGTFPSCIERYYYTLVQMEGVLAREKPGRMIANALRNARCSKDGWGPDLDMRYTWNEWVISRGAFLGDSKGPEEGFAPQCDAKIPTPFMRRVVQTWNGHDAEPIPPPDDETEDDERTDASLSEQAADVAWEFFGFPPVTVLAIENQSDTDTDPNLDDEGAVFDDADEAMWDRALQMSKKRN